MNNTAKQHNMEEQNHIMKVQLIKKLVSRDTRERNRAEQQLTWSGLSTVEDFITLLNAECERSKQRRRIAKSLQWTMLILFLFSLGLPSDANFSFLGVIFFTLLALTTIGAILWSQVGRSFQRGIAVALAKFDDL